MLVAGEIVLNSRGAAGSILYVLLANDLGASAREDDLIALWFDATIFLLGCHTAIMTRHF
jgi:hypothetical protein